MSEVHRKSILFLEGVPAMPTLCRVAGGVPLWAASPLEAAKLLARVRPQILVFRGDSEWQRTFAGSIPPERRPVTLMTGEAMHMDPSLFDEWLPAEHEETEAPIRLALARGRSRIRHKTARRQFVDVLTGLPNRRALVRGLVREAERAKRQGGVISLVLIDLDHFKEVNDRDGHPAGDRLLRRVGTALRRSTRNTELCGRFGGDEFAMVIAGELQDAQRAAARAKEALRKAGAPGSVGVCELATGESLKAFYRRTDCCLKSAKDARHKCVDEEHANEALNHPAHLMTPPYPAPDMKV